MDTPTTPSRESVEVQFDRWLAATLEYEHKRLREEIDAQRAALQAKSALMIGASETK